MSTTEAAEPWTCETCRQDLSTPYCPTCGEQRPRVVTLRDIARQAAAAFSNIDGKIIRSFRYLLTRPGLLTAAYLHGQRKAFLGPLQLFLTVNALFFAVQSASHFNIFSSPLSSHLQEQDWSSLAQVLVARRLEATHTTLAAYAPVFDKAAILYAKSLVILMVVVFSAILPVAFLHSRRPIANHVVFALHLYAFVLLLFCFDLGVAGLVRMLGGPGLESDWVDLPLTLFNLGACGAYLYLAIGKVYGVESWARAAIAAGLAVMTAVVLVLGYRFAIFLITLQFT
jgi:hypothetical protein